MKKKLFLLVLAVLFGFGLVACQDATTTTTTTTSGTTTTTTTSGTTTTTTTATPFSIALSGLTDVGFTEEDKLYVGDTFDLLEGVHAYGSDSVDYVNDIKIQADKDSCEIDDVNNTLTVGASQICTLTYSVVVNNKLDRETRLVKFTAVPVTIEFTETDRFDNTAIFGTDYVVTTENQGVNKFLYWTATAAILGETGSVSVTNNELVIAQEVKGDVAYALQAIVLTEVALEKGRTYKITLQITSDTERVIDIVTKAPNNDYANDTHSLIEVAVGTAMYEMIFVANQETLHLNIMTGAVEGNQNAGTLKFSNFTLFEGPIEIEYVEVEGMFDNEAVTVGQDVEYITTTDADYVREFYYWDNSNGTFITAETVEGGFTVEVLKEPANDYDIQLQWNDVNKSFFTLKTGAMYKVSFTVESDVARTIKLVAAGAHHTHEVSKEQSYDLKVGVNEIEMEFETVWDFLFIKIMLGNLGDLVNVGNFTFTNFQLFEDKNAVAVEEPVDDGAPIGNIFGEVQNVAGDLAVNPETDPVGEFFLWAGNADWGWNNYWTAFAEVTGSYENGEVSVDIVNESAPEFWGIQLKYHGGEISVNTEYRLSFVVFAETARTINVEVHNKAAQSAQYASQDFVLVQGYNFIELDFVAQVDMFNLQMNLGNFSEADESGMLTFSSFVLSRPVQEIEGYIENGDFETPQALGATDTDGWAVWTTQGIGDAWAQPNYEGTQTIADGVLTLTTTATGGAEWASQIQYNAPVHDLTVGAMYKVELDINSTVDTTIQLQFKGASNDGPHSTVTVKLLAGDNHVSVYLEAMQEQARFFILNGLTAVGTVLVVDNVKLYEPIIPTEPEEPVEEIRYALSDTVILNGDFDAEGFGVNVEGSSWSTWTTINETWTTPVDATFAVVEGALVVETLGVGDYVWSIQLQYRPALGAMDVVPGKMYKVEFDVEASVAGTFSMELTTTNNVANVAIPVTLEVGMNHVVVEYVAYEPQFMLTASIGQYGAAVLTFDNFVLYEEALFDFVPVADGIANGDFDAEGFGVNVEGTSWSTWTTINETWTTPVDATFAVVEGALVVETLGVGDYVWSIQLQYRPALGLMDVIPGNTYRVEFDVEASVAGTFSMELTTTNNVANVAIPVTLEVGMNHVVVEYVAYEPQFMLTASIGQYGAAVLTFDNFELFEEQVFVFNEVTDGIANGNFDAEGFGVNVEGTSWSTWTTINETWTTPVDATFAVVEGALVVETLGVGDYVWSIQLQYRPALGLMDVVPGNTYRVEFDVEASVAGTFSMELTTTNNVANVAIPVTLEVGMNHVVVEYVAYEPQFMLTASIGQYGAAVLTFDNFTLYEFVPKLSLVD